MFVLKRDPIYLYHQWKQTTCEYTNMNVDDKDIDQNKARQETPINPLQTLLSLTDINSLFIKLATLFSIAWETIAFAWVANLIETPDEYNQYKYRYNQRRQQHQSQSKNQQSHQDCQNQHTKIEYEFKPMPNVFDSWSRTSSISSNSSNSECSSRSGPDMHHHQPMEQGVNDDCNSWGQFVDVDLSNCLPRKQCFLR